MRYFPKKIEQKWQKKWLAEGTYEPDITKAKKPFYNLMMFPYPSAEGLHIGGTRTFTGIDIYGRFKRMQGYDVFEPIGLDGFGIHSENYALKIGKHPAQHAAYSEKVFYRQLAAIGNGFAWNERLETYDPEYYQWTQWIFVQMFKNGLACRKKATVNWCTSCKTVLADEQVINSRCERCDSEVIQKELEQWFFKITNYAERLLQNIEKIDWTEKVKIAQRNWIGKSEGAVIQFPISNFQFPNKTQIQDPKHQTRHIEVFTTRPDTLFGVTYVVLAPEHHLLTNHELRIANYEEVETYIRTAKNKAEADRIAEGKEKTGVELKGIKAINPANNEELPVWVADYVLGNVGTGAIMAVPAHDDRDLAFQKKYGLGIRRVIKDSENVGLTGTELAAYERGSLKGMADSGFAWTYGGVLMNSGKFDSVDSEKAKWEIAKFVGGKRKVHYRLRDWLISRQRYWGPPIPMIYCEQCAARGKGERKDMPGWYAVSEKHLPVVLPKIKNFRPLGTGQSPLASVKSFYETECPVCKSKARRETDVSDTFLDSAWYYLGYLMAFGNWKLGFGNSAFAKLTRRWLPVNMYIGGAEHSVLHLLYSRFLAMVFHDWKLLHFEEPFTKFRAHGLITKDGAKMSKSKGNVVSPDEYIAAYGADAMRMYLAFLAPLEQGGDFRDAGIKGITRFLERAYTLIFNFQFSISKKNNGQEVKKIVHRTIKKVTEDIENLQYNTAISALMILLNAFEEHAEQVTDDDIRVFLKLLAPFAPHMTEELWQQHFAKRGKFRSIHRESWPTYDSRLLVEGTFELIVQVNGKVRGRVQVRMGADQKEAEQAARAEKNVRAYLGGEPQKTIYIPNRLINFVV